MVTKTVFYLKIGIGNILKVYMEACTLCSYTNSNFHNNIINRQGAGEVQCRCMNYDPDDIDKDSQGFRIYCDDNANKLDTKHCH